MANFTSNSISYLDHNDLNWELLSPFLPTNNSTLVPNSVIDYQTLMGFSGDHQLITQSSSVSQEKLQGTSNPPTVSELVGSDSSYGRTNKRKVDELAETSSLNSSSPMSIDVNKPGKGKRTKTSDKAGEKPKEVVHVRAKRGQATDSHSIAERIRRGKINEKLKHLQDIVPGCNKTMGMAVMLDEIINYVQSLQNQVEFLSMKLTAASQFHDFNANVEPQDKPQVHPIFFHF
ncbi:hypothetical protein RND81_10G196400 [Saponaria officinalis]|uniref:BHLH domain-containing protein n=1 Tax=Saponaria officinalis TaxID=3572 RepID=A0AAW1I4X8_SAPOF